MTRSFATLALAPMLLAPLLLAACATPPGNAKPSNDASDTAAGQGQIILGIGESRRLTDGSLLTYTQLVNDSRCAPDVQCVWEGDAEIALRWKPAQGAAQELHLHTTMRIGPTTARTGSHEVKLLSLQRGIAPKATLAITPAT